jgi:signal transduction histidine kinase
VGQLAAGLAHEINTPMQYISDNLHYVKTSLDRMWPLLQMLQQISKSNETNQWRDEIRDELDQAKLDIAIEELPQALTDMEEGVTQVARVVRAMRDFSHSDAIERTTYDINQALETVIIVARNEWKYHADVVTDFDPMLPEISALAGELNQVLLNLLVNAAQAIEARVSTFEAGKGLISIRTRFDEENCYVELQDTGGGIPKSIQNRVFDPFFTTKEVGKGTGQGLAVAYQVVVKKHRGAIWFDVEEGVGTTFFIRLPRQSGNGLCGVELD